MCGLYGVAGDLDRDAKEVFELLALFSAPIRGKDSSGVVVVPLAAEREPSIIKAVGNPYGVFETTTWDRTSAFQSRALIGHVRKATVGGVSKRTAHPFNYGSLYGVHNGTLRNWRYLPGDALETDSMTLYDYASRVGMRTAIEEIEGAYALVWWDDEAKELNFLRNAERPLHYAFSECGKRIYWASEAWMLNIALAKCGVKTMDLSPKEEYRTSTQAIDTDMHFRVKLGVGKDAIKFLGETDAPKVGWELKGGVRPAKYAAVPFRKPETGTSGTGSSGTGGSQNGRVPFSWETGGLTVVDPFANQTPLLAASEPTPTAGASASTSESTSISPQTGTTSSDSRSPRPTLTLVRSSKSAGSEQSQQNNVRPDDDLNDSLELSPSERAKHSHRKAWGDVTTISGPYGFDYDKDDFESTEQKCCFCDVDIDWDDAKAGKIGKFLDESRMVCSTCLPQIS